MYVVKCSNSEWYMTIFEGQLSWCDGQANAVRFRRKPGAEMAKQESSNRVVRLVPKKRARKRDG